MNTLPGKYNVEYFTGAQMSLYIGDILIDELTSLQLEVNQSRTPIYGYASTLYDHLSEGQVIVQGAFTINFKEAGYLYVVQDNYRKRNGQDSVIHPFSNSKTIDQRNIESIINGEYSTINMNKRLSELAELYSKGLKQEKSFLPQSLVRSSGRSLGGYASDRRHEASAGDSRGYGRAEGIFEQFENKVWKTRDGRDLDNAERRADDPRMNPFDIFLTYGDFMGSNDDYDNHTIRRLRDVSIVGMSHSVQISDLPLQERYTFVARNIV